MKSIISMIMAVLVFLGGISYANGVNVIKDTITKEVTEVSEKDVPLVSGEADILTITIGGVKYISSPYLEKEKSRLEEDVAN